MFNLTCEIKTPNITKNIPIIFCKLKFSFNIKNEKIAVNIGIRFVKMLAELMPSSFKTFVKRTNARTLAKIVSAKMLTINLKSGLIDKK